MSRHLGRDFFAPALARGKSIECFVGGATSGGQPTIRWVVIRREEEDNEDEDEDDAGGRDRFVAALHEAYDPRDPDLSDVGEFQSIRGDAGEPIDERRFADLDAALAHAVQKWGAREDRFVNEGMVGHEYEAYLNDRQAQAEPHPRKKT